jgi:hypothetical protein
MRSERLDRSELTMHPLSERRHLLVMEDIAKKPSDPVPKLSERVERQVVGCAEHIRKARSCGKPVMVTYGAHFIKNGLAPLLIRLIEERWVTHAATNGAGTIHDWEFAFLGKSTEDVRANTAAGRFGTWEETGRFTNLAVAVGGVQGLGYGASIGAMIAEEGLTIPSRAGLAREIADIASEELPGEELGALSDLLHLVTRFDLPPGRMEIGHPFRRFSVQYAATKVGIPFTVHPGLGYDIVYTHPMNNGGAMGRGGVWDFLQYAGSIAQLGGGGVHLTIGSSVMAPMIFEKSLSMANNRALKRTGKALEDYYIGVIDIADGGDWDWSQGEPPKDNPAYYLRFCKTFNRMGGTLDYLCVDNAAFMLNLCRELGVS